MLLNIADKIIILFYNCLHIPRYKILKLRVVVIFALTSFALCPAEEDNLQKKNEFNTVFDNILTFIKRLNFEINTDFR